MRTEKEFKHFYTTYLQEEIDHIEHIRGRTIKTILIQMGIMIFLLATYHMFVTINKQIRDIDLSGVLLTSTALMFFYSVYYYKKQKKVIGNKIKENIIPIMVYFMNPSFSYLAHSHISRTEFLASNFYHPSLVDSLEGDDMVEGHIEQTRVRFSEITAKEIKKTEDGKPKKYVIFQGLFFTFDFNKYFEGSLYVIPKRTLNRLDRSSRLRKTNITGELLNKVEMENGVFNDSFDVRSTDQHIARYVLTPKLMENLMNLQKEAKTLVMFSFVDGKMYLAQNTGKKHFDIRMFSTFGEAAVAEYYNDLEYAFSIVEELRLNERLWI